MNKKKLTLRKYRDMKKFLIFILFSSLIQCRTKKDDTKKEMWLLLAFLPKATSSKVSDDVFTPDYYSTNSSLKSSIDSLVLNANSIVFQNPFQDNSGSKPSYSIALNGNFGTGKGPNSTGEHHTGTDYHLNSSNLTSVNLYAVHDGIIYTTKSSSKYRHYLSITKTITDPNGTTLGKLVSIYAHIDLDLDETAGLNLNGSSVVKGQLVSKNLYSGTTGGPHLHFEIRYSRPNDNPSTDFYGGIGTDSSFISKSTGPWQYGYWNPNMGYGFSNSEKKF